MKRAEQRRTVVFGQLETIARDNSGGDPVMAEVLLLHLRYNWGKGRNPWVPWIDEPLTVNGVRFWCVGENASHEFYVGTDGSGKRFRYTTGESCTVDILGNPLMFDDDGFLEEPAGTERDFREVTDFSGYLGHR